MLMLFVPGRAAVECDSVDVVLSACHITQVLNAVISFVSIDVVDLVNGPTSNAPGINHLVVTTLNGPIACSVVVPDVDAVVSLTVGDALNGSSGSSAD